MYIKFNEKKLSEKSDVYNVKSNDYGIKTIDFSNYKSFSHGIFLNFKDGTWIQMYYQEPNYVSGYSISGKKSNYNKYFEDLIDKTNGKMKDITVDYLKKLAGI